MNKLFVFLLVITFFFSCEKRENKFQIDFTFDNMFNTAYSIKIDSNRTIFLKKGRSNSKYYQSILSQERILKLEKYTFNIG